MFLELQAYTLSACSSAGCAAFAVLLGSCLDNEHAVTQQLPLFTPTCYLQVNHLRTPMHSQGGNQCQETRMQL